MAIVRMSIWASIRRNDGSANRSGEQYKSRKRPATSSCSISLASSGDSELFRAAAAMPLARSASTWSFISEMSGETTTVTASLTTAGA